MASRARSMLFWKKDKEETPASTSPYVTSPYSSSTDLKLDPEAFEGKDVGLFSLFVPFVKNYATSMSKTKNPAKLPYPTCFYLPQSSLMHMVTLQMSHVDLLIDASMQETPLTRFLDVVKYCASTYSLTKFPYKPAISLLGETAEYSSSYRNGAVDFGDKTYVLAENVKKDPPKSCFYITNPKHGVTHEGQIDLDPKFERGHVHVRFQGQNKTTLHHPGGLFHEVFYSNIPDLMIRLLRMHTELVGEVTISSTTGFVAKIAFKEKGLFNKAKNQVTGKISANGVDLYTIDGAWDEILYLTEIYSGQRTEFLNKTALPKNVIVPPPPERQPLTSCDRIWSPMIDALLRQDFDAATQIKAQINANDNCLLEPEHIVGNNQELMNPRYFERNSAGIFEIKDPGLAIALGEGIYNPQSRFPQS